MNSAIILRRLSSDSAESSIMQTITVAVSAILVTSGLIVVPNIVNNNKDAQITSDLKNVALAQNYRSANTGSYVTDLSVIESPNGTKITMTPDSWTRIKLNNTIGYGILGVSSTGRVWVINPKISKAVYVGDVKFNGEGATKTIRPSSYIPVGGSRTAEALAAFTNSGFVAADVYTASKNS